MRLAHVNFLLNFSIKAKIHFFFLPLTFLFSISFHHQRFDIATALLDRTLSPITGVNRKISQFTTMPSTSVDNNSTISDVLPTLEQTNAGRIGRYQIIKTLGEGSFGTVKLAYHLATHDRVALKIINRKTLAKSDMQGHVEREISYLRLLRHPHIIKLYDVIKSKDEIIMVIEYAGKELFDYIVQKGRMEEDEARRFFQQIISAVEYCHKHKIVHRDLKPENLLLDENMKVKIADFGLSNIMTDGNFLKTSCGSPNYAAPEVISGKLYAGPEVDVWSCGVILYVMLCGRLPFDDEFIPNLFKKISEGVYTIPSGLSPGAKSLLRRMLVVNPLNRITVDEIMQDPWFRYNIDRSLLPPEAQDDNNTREDIDFSLVTALSLTMGFSKEQIYDALTHPNGDGGAIRDAYQLLKDNRLLDSEDTERQSEIDKYMVEDTSTQERNKKFPASRDRKDESPPALTFDKLHGGSLMEGGVNQNSTIAILPTSLPAYHRANMIAYGSPSMRKLNPVSTKKSKTRWHFGIRSRSYPLDVMCEIYRALKNLGAEWAVPTEDDLWTIRVRWKCDLADGTSQKMKMRIQLYRIQRDNYLVDFKFDGWEEAQDQPQRDTFSAYPFLHLATKLIMELAVNSQSG